MEELVMNLKPYVHIIYDSHLKAQEITERLKAQTEPMNYFRVQLFQKSSGKMFEGKVLENSFQIQRLINYRNSFLPVIKGTIDEGVFGTKVHISMQFNMFVKVFMAIWISIMLIGLVSIMSMAYNEEGFWIALPIILGTTLFFVLVAILAFRYEVKKAKVLLEELLGLTPAY